MNQWSLIFLAFAVGALLERKTVMIYATACLGLGAVGGWFALIEELRRVDRKFFGGVVHFRANFQ